MKPESESIIVHRSPAPTTIVYLDHGESLGVPTAVIGLLGFSTLGFFLKLLGLPEADVASMLRLYDKHEPEILENWVNDLQKAGYVWRKRRHDGAWQYVISNRVLSIEEAADRMQAQDRAIAEGKEKAK